MCQLCGREANSMFNKRFQYDNGEIVVLRVCPTCYDMKEVNNENN
jgi:ribosome-binding protein aMBF1 (putative translation factor)